jgi:uncharacterized protein YndB with AHSA1/START domain
MGSYVLRRRIAAPPDRVFEAFIQRALIVDWMDATSLVDVTGPLDQPGTRYTLVISGPWRFRARVVRVDPAHAHEVEGRGPLGASYRMVATLTPGDGGTDLELLTEYGMPFGALGRWIDRRWIDREPRRIANREIDRLATLVSEPSAVPQPKGASKTAAG